jgi:DNA-binding NtrC family response regulator
LNEPFDASRFAILVVDDEKNVRFSLSERFRGEYGSVHTASNGHEAYALLEAEPIDLVLLDQKLKESGEDGLAVLAEIKKRHSHVVVIIMTAFGRFDQAMEAARLDCYQYLSKPLDLDQLAQVMRNGLNAAAMQREVARLRETQRQRYKVTLVMGENARMREVVALGERVARSSSVVLVTGETGVGKELVARLVHFHSPRSHAAFVEVNCSSIPEGLIESELFGHERGAFTDARRAKPGLFELADGGTLFLDEIGELKLQVQAKLLRVLENRTFRRVGGTDDRKVDVRVVCATHRDLGAMVRAGEFREDLYYRISVIPVEVPPLRERLEDIPALVRFFVDLFASEFHLRVTKISPRAMEALVQYRWPGNVRELRNVIERTLLTLDGEELSVEHLPPSVRGQVERRMGSTSTLAPAYGAEGLWAPGNVPTLAELERWGIERAMEATGQNKTRAAELLGISRQTLRMKLRETSPAGADDEDDPAPIATV